MQPIKSNFELLPTYQPKIETAVTEKEPLALLPIWRFGQEKNFATLQLGGVIDHDGKACETLMCKTLPAILNCSKKNIISALNLLVFPKAKDLNEIPLQKRNLIISVFESLEKEYEKFPFYFNKDENTIGLQIEFSLKNLMTYVDRKIPFMGDLKMYGEGVTGILGKEYIVYAINSVLEEGHKILEENASHINKALGYEFFQKCASLEKIEEALIDFFLNEISHEDKDTDKFRFLIRELVFKNLYSLLSKKFFVGFANSKGSDIDLTFSLTAPDEPFTYANGLMIDIPRTFELQGQIAPYSVKGINPYQCLSDKLSGILNGPVVDSSQVLRKLSWIISSIAKGERLLSLLWEDHIVKSQKYSDIAKLKATDEKLSEKLFVKMIEAVNVFILMQKNNLLTESGIYWTSICKDLEMFKAHLLNEDETTCKILSTLFFKFSDPVKGLYYLYLTALYAMPLENPSMFSLGYTHRGTLALQISFKGIYSTLFFSEFFNETYSLNKDESLIVEKWISYFVKKGTVSFDKALFDPFIKSSKGKVQAESTLGITSGYEDGLSSYDNFVRLNPLTWFLSATSPEIKHFAISRINAQFNHGEKRGFDLTEKALKGGKPHYYIALAFIQDLHAVSPQALRSLMKHLVDELKNTLSSKDFENVLNKWIELALRTDWEMALTLKKSITHLKTDVNVKLLSLLIEAFAEDKVPCKKEVVQMIIKSQDPYKKIVLENLGVINLCAYLLKKNMIDECLFLIDHFKNSKEMRLAFIEKCSHAKEELIEKALPATLENAFLFLIETFEMESLNLWMQWKNYLPGLSPVGINKFLLFFANLKAADIDKDSCFTIDKDSYFILFEQFKILINKNAISLPEYFVGECFRTAKWIKEDDKRNLFKISVLKIFNKAVCTKGETSKIAYYFIHRKDFPSDCPYLEKEDALAFSFFPIKTEIPCFKEALYIGIQLYSKKNALNGSLEKAYAILEKAVVKDKSLKNKASELAGYLKLEKNFSVMRCCCILNNCFDTLRDEDLTFWTLALLDCVEKVSHKATISIKKEIFITISGRISKKSFDIIFSHKMIQTLLTKEEIQACHARFLGAVFLKSLPHESLTDEDILSIYEELFPKLELGSLNERGLTTLAINLYCNVIQRPEGLDRIVNGLFALGSSIINVAGLHKYTHCALDVLLWSPNIPFSKSEGKIVNDHINMQRLKPWQDRLFQITKELLTSMLAISSTNIEACDSILTVTAHITQYITNGNSKALELVDLFDKLLFSQLSTINFKVHLCHMSRCKDVYMINVAQESHEAKLEIFYKTTLMVFHKEWLSSSLQPERKISLFREVLNWNLLSNQPFMIYKAIKIMQAGTTNVFGKNDELRSFVLMQIIGRTLKFPYCRVDAAPDFEADSLKMLKNIVHKELKAMKEILNDEFKGITNTPLLRALIDCIVLPNKQLVTYDNKDASKKGPTILNKLSEELLVLIDEDEQDVDVKTYEFIEILFTLWQRGRGLFASEMMYVEMLENVMFLLPKIFVMDDIKVSLLKTYADLLTVSLKDIEAIDKRVDLFHRFITELLKSQNRDLHLLGKELLQKGMLAGVYKTALGKIGKDAEFMKLLNS